MINGSRGEHGLPVTRIARWTAAGRAAVATLGVVGPDAMRLVGQHLELASGQRLEDVRCGNVVLGRWISSVGSGEELVVCCHRPDHVEVHCHGGEAALQVIQDSLLQSGCILDGSLVPGQSDDPISVQAWEAMILARTRRGALLMLSQYHGALRKELNRARDALEQGDVREAVQCLEELERWGDLGCHVTNGWKVGLVGPPNAGKSSLVNALLGFRRSIVDDQPGTTRDLVSADTAWDGWPVQLIDTAGLRETSESLEQEGVDRVWERQGEIDLLLLVFPGDQPWSPDAQRLHEAFPHALIVYNKSDLGRTSSGPTGPAGLATSAVTGAGLDVLIEQVLQRLVPSSPRTEAALPFTEVQVSLVRELLGDLASGCVEDAIRRLGDFLQVGSCFPD